MTGASGGTGVSFSSDLCSSALCWSVLVAGDGVGLRLSCVRDSCAIAREPCGNGVPNNINAATAIPLETKRRATFMSETSSIRIAKTISAATRIQMRSVTNCNGTVADQPARCLAGGKNEDTRCHSDVDRSLHRFCGGVLSRCSQFSVPDL